MRRVLRQVDHGRWAWVLEDDPRPVPPDLMAQAAELLARARELGEEDPDDEHELLERAGMR